MDGGLEPRVLGFDVGDRRIGLAISDPLGYTAQPLFTLHRAGRRADLKSVGRVLRKHGVTEAVVGNPLYMSGDQSPQAAKAQAFAEELRAEFGITVHLWDERLTTTQAHRHLDDAGHAAMGRKGIIDQVAAVLILQSFLEASDVGIPFSGGEGAEKNDRSGFQPSSAVGNLTQGVPPQRAKNARRGPRLPWAGMRRAVGAKREFWGHPIV
jgi:putative Holliday junction resolvase